MAYSMFERPKLHNAKSLKFYPEEHDHHVSFRHKNLPPNFELTVEKEKSNRRNHSLEGNSSTYKKCPIYVHNFDTSHQTEGDFIVNPSKKTKKPAPFHKSVIDKLEEKYWANWKPDKTGSKSSKLLEVPVLQNEKLSEIKIIKSAPERRRKNSKTPHNRPRETRIKGTTYRLQKNTSKSQEIQTDDLEAFKEEEGIDIGVSREIATEKYDSAEKNVQKDSNAEKKDTEVNTVEVGGEAKFLKHTDSLILTFRKKRDGKEDERFEQPKCIRLYKKTKVTAKNYVRGGSYPLKSCLKKESNLNKSKLTRPGSPMIVSSNLNSKNSKAHRR